MATVCRCPDMKFDVHGSVVPLPQGSDPTCPSCYPGQPITAATWGRITGLLTDAGYPTLPPEQCTSEGQFGPCAKRCVYPAGHDGMHRSQCVVWDDTGWTQYDQTGETVAAVSYTEKIDLGAQPYTGPITDNQYVELFLRGEFYVVTEEKS